MVSACFVISAHAEGRLSQVVLPADRTHNAIIDGKKEKSKFQWAEISFDDIAPPQLSLQQCWNAMGMDNKGRVYIGFTSDREAGAEDFSIFRYDPRNGRRDFLGTLMDVARSAGNLSPGENIPKGHTRLILADGKMYMGSQGFHDFKYEIDDLPKYRGAHIFALNTIDDGWEDLSSRLPGGVVVENEGVVAMSALRKRNLLVGLTHPHSNIILFDYKAKKIEKVVPGIPWQLGNPLSREVIVAPSGRIYTYRGTELPSQREARHTVWVYDPQTDKMTNTHFEMTGGFWIGQTSTRDGRTIYVSTTNGRLYAFDTANEIFEDLGDLLPERDIESGRTIEFMYGVTLSPDERKLFYVPALIDNPEGSGELYSYDIASGKVSFLHQLPEGTYTTADLRDDKRIYMAHFGTKEDVWKGRARLMVISVPEMKNAHAN